MIAQYDPLIRIFDEIGRRRQSQRAAAEVAEKLIFNVSQELDKFEEVYLG